MRSTRRIPITFHRSRHFLFWAQNDPALLIWRGTGELIAALKGHIGEVQGALALAGGHFLFWATDDPSIRLWHSETGRQICLFYGDAPITCHALSTDGKTVLADDTQGRIQFVRWVGEFN